MYGKLLIARTRATAGARNVQRAGYSSAAVERYNADKKKTGSPNAGDADWTAWRRDQVTETVKKCRDALRAVRQQAVFSAGGITFGQPPRNRQEYITASDTYNYWLQDWIGWCETGLIDVNVLQDYKDTDKRLADFEDWMSFTLENKGKAKVVIGVGGWLNVPERTLAMMVMPVFDSRADGVAVYGYHDPYKGAQGKADFAMFRQVLDPVNVQGKAGEVAAIKSKPTARGESRLAAFITMMGGTVAAPAAVAPAPAVASAPAAPAKATPSNAGSMPSLPPIATKNTAAALPDLPGASPSSSAASSIASLPALPSTSSSPGASISSLPSLPGSSASGSAASASLPDLPGASAPAPGATTPGKALGQLPDLPAGAPAPSPDAGSVSGLPALTEAASPTSPVELSERLPDLPRETSAPEPEKTTSRKTATKSGESQPSDVSPIPSLSDVTATEAPPQPAAVPVPEPALIATPAAPAAVAIPVETPGRTTVTIPDYGSMTNYTGDPIAGSRAAVPTFVAPSVRTPEAVAPGQFTELPLGREKPLAAPAIVRPDYSERNSPYGTPNPPSQIRNYAGVTNKKPPVMAVPGVGAPPLDIIVLRDGKEFSGRVISRGEWWRIQLPNGSLLQLPGSRIATVRAPVQSLDVNTQQ